MFKEYIYAQRYLRHLELVNRLEKLAEMFLNTFHREKMFKKRCGKGFAKNSSKNLQLDFFKYFFLVENPMQP